MSIEKTIHNGNPISDIPRLNIACYCESKDLYDATRQIATDRRLQKSKISIYSGGIQGAIDTYYNTSTPDLLVIESHLSTLEILSELEGLSELCGENTFVIIIGTINDIDMYRELIKHGISDYLTLPVTPNLLIQSIASLFTNTEITLAPEVSFIGASGGVGTSIIAQNFSTTMAEIHNLETFFLDLDMAYGTSQLNWGIGSIKTFKDLFEMRSIDDNIIYSLRSQVSKNLYTLGGAIDPMYNLNLLPDIEEKLDSLHYSLQSLHDLIVVDIASVGSYNFDTKSALLKASHVYMVIIPTPKNIRNSANLYKSLCAIRPNDPSPKIILNQMNMPDINNVDIKYIKEAFDKEPEYRIEYSPEIIEKYIIEETPIVEIAENSQVSQEIQNIAQDFLGKKRIDYKKSSFLSNLLQKKIS